MTFKVGRYRIPIVATLISMLAFVIMLKLGFWQLDRAKQKTQRLEQIHQRQQFQPYSLGELLRRKGDIRDYPVEVKGHFIQEKQFLIDNRIVQSQIGYHVVALFQTNWGVLVVNLGWIKAPATRDILPSVSLPATQQVLKGTIATPDLNPMVNDPMQNTQTWPARIQQIDLQQMQSVSHLNLLPVVLQLAPDPSQALIRQWQPVVMPPEKHIAYAIQWFGLALASLIITLIAVIRYNREIHNE